MTDYAKLPSEDELDRLIEEAEPVYSVEWDSGSPGSGAGAELVYRWKGGYFVVSDQDAADELYPTLRDAIEETELYLVTGATQKIRSSELTSEEIAAMLRTVDRGRYQVLVNGEPWVTDGSRGFRRA